MSNETYVRSCLLTFKSNLDLMISDPLPEALNTHAQLFISPHLGRPYSRFILAVNSIVVGKELRTSCSPQVSYWEGRWW